MIDIKGPATGFHAFHSHGASRGMIHSNGPDIHGANIPAVRKGDSIPADPSVMRHGVISTDVIDYSAVSIEPMHLSWRNAKMIRTPVIKMVN